MRPHHVRLLQLLSGKRSLTGLAVLLVAAATTLLLPSSGEDGRSPAKPAAGNRAEAESQTATGNLSDSAETDLRFGLLRGLPGDRFLSPAGLIYGPGSAEGHRLEHLRRHVNDSPQRAGPHGVFSGGMKEALRVVDEAYRKAETGRRTVTRKDRRRVIHTVDLQRVVGYVGGRQGARDGKPPTRRVRIVLEGNRVITAFPLD